MNARIEFKLQVTATPGFHSLYDWCFQMMWLVLATALSDPPAVRVWTRQMIQFGTKSVQKPDPLLLGGSNPAAYRSTRGIRQVCLDPSCAISGCAFRVVVFMVAFRCPTVNRKISMIIPHCFFWMYWLPLCSIQVDKCSLTHPGNEHQRSVNDFRFASWVFRAGIGCR